MILVKRRICNAIVFIRSICFFGFLVGKLLLCLVLFCLVGYVLGWE
jgi:hypothetical protein